LPTNRKESGAENPDSNENSSELEINEEEEDN
jgi:hypothetical protein